MEVLGGACVPGALPDGCCGVAEEFWGAVPEDGRVLLDGAVWLGEVVDCGVEVVGTGAGGGTLDTGGWGGGADGVCCVEEDDVWAAPQVQQTRRVNRRSRTRLFRRSIVSRLGIDP